MTTASMPGADERVVRSSRAKVLEMALILTAISETDCGRVPIAERCDFNCSLALALSEGVTESSRSYVMLSDLRDSDLESIFCDEAGTGYWYQPRWTTVNRTRRQPYKSERRRIEDDLAAIVPVIVAYM